ncbi:metalloregulator ArsR/SmtB family transcription factor [Myceligenerans pegani]|uniref:Winged helix-turn-helix transcriptional regulator n=1 Tax=Myceligenerans pegani TaxID=2776917 RepID=A0ABR9N422_9MICO|nr:metalloregulator ArsR/SmtB family transcription factor [Myceligenerans sp. TRM 65318]MBE1878414.1 winged helix-turn-helix transcriptional regulator [Myceligenerans sp. TRM 65318]MBE3020685.1 winged helix-turn-helix transcriptional regulator [Myceligenerans sp. TRM 65318]
MQGARAIADPVRREILELLHAAPRSAGTIAEHFAISRPAVSKHLRILRDCGVIEATAVGRHRVYALRTEPLREVAAYLDRLLGPALPGRLDALATEVARTRRERHAAQAAPGSDPKEKTA